MEAINISDLVLDEDEQSAPIVKVRQKSKPSYEVVANSGADIAIRRTQGKSKKLLVLLVSQKQFYVKNENTGEIRKLDDKTLSMFMSGSGGDVEVGGQWLDALNSDKAERDFLLRVLHTEGFCDAASSGIWSMADARPHYSWEYKNPPRTYEALLRMIAEHLSLAKSTSQLMKDADAEMGKLTKSSFPAFCAIEDVYGLDRARTFAERYATSDIKGAIPGDVIFSLLHLSVTTEFNRYTNHYRAVNPHRMHLNQIAAGDLHVTFSFERLCDYLLVQSLHEGFEYDMRDWAETWGDDLMLQHHCFGKIADKYPENLLSHHKRLSTNAQKLKCEIDEKLWSYAEASMGALDWSPEDEPYIITHPHDPEDMRAEAKAQSNCLAGYVSSVTKGASLIAFLRKASSPETSFVTIEVSPTSLELRQVKARFNGDPDADALSFIGKWCREKGIDPCHYRQRIEACSANQPAA